MKLNKITLMAFLAAIALLPACGKKSQKIVQPLISLNERSPDVINAVDNVTINVKKLNEQDCVSLFGKNGARIVRGKEGHLPIQFSITNDSPTTWQLKKENISLKLASPQTVMRQLKTHPLITALGFATLTTLLATTSYFAFTSAIVGFEVMMYIGAGGEFILLDLALGTISGLGATVCPFIAVPRVINKTQTNQLLINDLRSLMLDHMIIEAGQTKDFLIFVKKKRFENNFTVTLESKNNKQQLLFNIDYSQQNQATSTCVKN